MNDNVSTMKNIAIMGGTFDPIHYGHLIVAESIRKKFNIGEVWFMPTGSPPHKLNEGVTPATFRYMMTFLAIMGNPHFTASTLEVNRTGHTYTVDTLAELKESFPNIHFHFIIGADIVKDLVTWKEPERLFTMCEFIAVARPKYSKKKLLLEIDKIQQCYNGKIHFFEAPLFDISSSDIRERVSKGDTIKYMLPEPVESYIDRFRLYKNE